MEDGSPASRASGSTSPASPTASIFRVLENLLILDGERLSYRTLDVEQIGSVYETMMGFDLEVAEGRSRSPSSRKKSHGAPTTINLDALLAAKPADRAKWLKDDDRPGAHRPGGRRAQGGRRDRRPARRPGQEDRPRGHAQRRAQGRDGPAADRRAPPQRLALHAAVAHRADRPHDARSRS